MIYSLTNKDYILLDSAISVHIFHKKKRFSKFKKLTKGQDLLCRDSLILIEGWGEVLLLLKNRIQKSILISKRVVFISNILVNLVSLAYIQDQEFD